MSNLKMNKNINGNDLNGFALSLRKDGKTYRKGDATAYSNVGVDVATGQFLALVTMDDRMRELSGKKNEVCIHLSLHATILEAAYAASVFHADLDNNLRALKGKPNRTYNCGPIPAFTYAAIDTPEHMKYRAGLRDQQSNRAASKAASKDAKDAAKAATAKAAYKAKQERIYEAALNMPEFDIGEGVKTFIKIDPTALALSRTILRDLKTRHGERKVNGKLAAYAKRNGAASFTSMTVAKFEQQVLAA